MLTCARNMAIRAKLASMIEIMKEQHIFPLWSSEAATTGEFPHTLQAFQVFSWDMAKPDDQERVEL